MRPGDSTFSAVESADTRMAGFAPFRPRPPDGRTAIPAARRYAPTVPRRICTALSKRRNDHPNRPSAMTCCFFSSLKTLLTRRSVNLPASSMSRFSYLVGRFSGVHLWPVLSVPRGNWSSFRISVSILPCSTAGLPDAIALISAYVRAPLSRSSADRTDVSMRITWWVKRHWVTYSKDSSISFADILAPAHVNSATPQTRPLTGLRCGRKRFSCSRAVDSGRVDRLCHRRCHSI